MIKSQSHYGKSQILQIDVRKKVEVLKQIPVEHPSPESTGMACFGRTSVVPTKFSFGASLDRYERAETA